MSRLRAITGDDMTKILLAFGFDEVRRRGSHARFRHEDGRVTTVPIHSGQILGKGLLLRILRDADISRDEFHATLREM